MLARERNARYALLTMAAKKREMPVVYPPEARRLLREILDAQSGMLTDVGALRTEMKGATSVLRTEIGLIRNDIVVLNDRLDHLAATLQAGFERL